MKDWIPTVIIIAIIIIGMSKDRLPVFCKGEDGTYIVWQYYKYNKDLGIYELKVRRFLIWRKRL